MKTEIVGAGNRDLRPQVYRLECWVSSLAARSCDALVVAAVDMPGGSCHDVEPAEGTDEVELGFAVSDFEGMDSHRSQTTLGYFAYTVTVLNKTPLVIEDHCLTVVAEEVGQIGVLDRLLGMMLAKRKDQILCGCSLVMDVSPQLV